MDKTKLTAYLKCLYELEASLYYQKRVYNVVSNEQQNVLASYRGGSEIPHKKPEPEESDAMFITVIACMIVVFFLMIVIFNISVEGYDGYPIFKRIIASLFLGVMSGVIIGGLVGAAIGKIIEKKDEKRKAQQAFERVVIENREIDRRNAEIRARNADSKALVRRKAAAVELRLNEIKQGIDETQKTLNQYYGLNIVFEKYRNFVAISSIYEYFVSGRCQELEGPYGAYNKFEEELRQNMIIARLDDVLRSLSRIERNQSMLYHAIQEGNRAVQQIQRGIQGMSSNIQRIENNSEITAYNSRIAAENTEYMKNLQIYDILTRR